MTQERQYTGETPNPDSRGQAFLLEELKFKLRPQGYLRHKPGGIPWWCFHCWGLGLIPGQGTKIL